MADPARYTVDPVLNEGSQTAGLHTERTPYGEWVKWHDFQDYKDAQRRNKSEATAVKLGLEVVSLNNRIEELTAENERLRKAGDELYKWAGAENRPSQQVYAAWLAAKEGAAK